MFIELQLTEEGEMISINMNLVQTIYTSTRINGCTEIAFGEESVVVVYEPYESVMARVRQ